MQDPKHPSNDELPEPDFGDDFDDEWDDEPDYWYCVGCGTSTGRDPGGWGCPNCGAIMEPEYF